MNTLTRLSAQLQSVKLAEISIPAMRLCARAACVSAFKWRGHMLLGLDEMT